MDFPTDVLSIEKRITRIDPIAYARNRNFLNGSVTHLSPYITHGYVSLPELRDRVLQKYTKKESYIFIFELAWREFFQRVWEQEGDAIFYSLKHTQENVLYTTGLPTAYVQKKTTIHALDTALFELEKYGYIHNHARMWLAMLVCTVAKTDWYEGARHMYYHLLDGDRASNSLSWQWVAGTFSSKPYIANQEMINKFANTKQTNTYLDTTVEILRERSVPQILTEHSSFELVFDDSMLLSESMQLSDITQKEIWVYSMWTLDPKWAPTTNTNIHKILFIDSEDLALFPMSPMRIEFILSLSRNIQDLKIYYGTREEFFSRCTDSLLYRKHHAALIDWPGTVSEPEYLFSGVNTISGSFMSFWKKCEKFL
ncbi:MAG: hypothetical protein RI996_31 [Candidatus Parcubacteria bacterium]|jgi:deoxyribodipyrimidine photo-lyase